MLKQLEKRNKTAQKRELEAVKKQGRSPEPFMAAYIEHDYACPFCSGLLRRGGGGGTSFGLGAVWACGCSWWRQDILSLGMRWHRTKLPEPQKMQLVDKPEGGA